MAQDEITQLLEPKVFTNAKTYTKDGAQEFTGFTRDAALNKKRGLPKGTITDNLIIKGNNLLALHSLKKEFAEKVKLIYIDPPYNTGNDSFGYNDSFNHSTWLTFMKNRLEIAKQLLHKEGSVFVQIDDFEDSYLKVLMDDVFGTDHFRNKITWKRRGGSANPSNRLNNVVDYIIWYSKSNNFTFKSPFTLSDENTQKYIKERFTNKEKDGRKFMKSPLQSPNPRPNLMYDYKGYKTPKNGWSISQTKMKDWDKEGKLWFPKDKEKNINRKIYLDEYNGQPVSSLWTDISVINPMSKERGDFEGGQKPEALLARMIEMVTNKGDVVLDFFVGSGTTSASAHKMQRQHIGVEQLDYIEPLPLKRLIDVVNGEDSGISKKYNWQGGGSFTYLELKKYNQTFIEHIEAAKNSKALLEIWEQMKAKSFLNYNVDLKKQEKHKEDFIKDTLVNQKRLLLKLLDLNQLYVNLSSMHDDDFEVSPEDQKVTADFYQLNR